MPLTDEQQVRHPDRTRPGITYTCASRPWLS